MTGLPSRVMLATIALAAVAFVGLTPSRAAAVELYYDAHGHVVTTPTPVRVVVHNPVRHPRRYFLRVNNVLPPPRTPPRVVVAVQGSPPPPATVVVDRGRDRERDPYDTDGLVVAGAGAGGLFFLGDGVTHVAASYRLHVGLAVGPAEFALRFDLVPDAPEVQTAEGGTTPSALYTMGASFNYRFLERAVVHPVMGVGLESIVLDPHEGDTGTAFAVTARAGLELAYPLSDGALALGIDVTGHHPFGATEEYASDVVDMLSFGAFADYRF